MLHHLQAQTEVFTKHLSVSKAEVMSKRLYKNRQTQSPQQNEINSCHAPDTAPSTILQPW